jgi:hypothetical protein
LRFFTRPLRWLLERCDTILNIHSVHIQGK